MYFLSVSSAFMLQLLNLDVSKADFGSCIPHRLLLHHLGV
jgi:hypothetical protein